MKEAGATLGITARTVAFHKYRIMTKLGATSNLRLLKLAMDQKLYDITAHRPRPCASAVADKPVNAKRVSNEPQGVRYNFS
jgi:hypothetical protein